jgi:hypothetical protein
MACKHEGGTDPCDRNNSGACRAHVKAYREANCDSLREKRKAYIEANRERLREQHKAYYIANRDERRARTKAWKATNRERVKVYLKETRERRAIKQKELYEKYRALGVCGTHPGVKAVGGTRSCAECLYRAHERGVRKLGRVNELSREHFMWLISQKCAYCGGQATGVDRAKNEFGYTLLNSVPCCKTCNFTKLRSTVKAFIVAVNAVARYCPDYPKFKRRWERIRKKLTKLGEKQCLCSSTSVPSATPLKKDSRHSQSPKSRSGARVEDNSKLPPVPLLGSGRGN